MDTTKKNSIIRKTLAKYTVAGVLKVRLTK